MCVEKDDVGLRYNLLSQNISFARPRQLSAEERVRRSEQMKKIRINRGGGKKANDNRT